MTTMKKAQTGKTVKSTNPADTYPPIKDKRGKSTIGGGEGKIPSGPKTGRRKPTMGSAKNGKSFPDLNKDGKVTKADILKGRGVIAKKGATIEKAQNGTREKVSTVSKLKPRKVIPFLHRAAPNFSRRTLNSPLPSAESILRKKAKSGTSMKKCKGGC